MSIIFRDTVRYICRLDQGKTILNAYTPIEIVKVEDVTPLNFPPL